MYIATVIPIKKGVPFDALSYYATTPLESGTVVTIPFGKQKIPGAIVETIPLIEGKALVKGASFSLKKIHAVVGTLPVLRALIDGAKDAAIRSATPVGSVLAALIPGFLADHLLGMSFADLEQAKREPKHFEQTAVSGAISDRTDHYKRLVRSAFALRESVLFVAPTIRSLEAWKGRLEKGIGRHVVIFHGKTTKRDVRAHFATVKNSEAPLLIFATPGFAGIPRGDIGTIVVEDESSSLYRTSDRFEIDLRTVLEAFARHWRAGIVWGDTIPRFETLYAAGADHLPRTFVPEKLHVLPVAHYRTTLPTEVTDLIRHARVKKRRIFIYTDRKGVAPLSRCNDCGTAVACPTCTLPMALRTVAGERSFVCTHCGDTLPSEHLCVHCGSWDIRPFAVGTESIYKAVTEAVGEEHVIAIDGDLAPDTPALERAIESVAKSRFAVIIGTSKVFSYLERIHYVIIPFFDRVLSTPSIYTTEHALRLVMQCDELASDGVIVCTRTPEFPFTRALEMKKVNGIIHDELELRRTLGYPPFGAIVKISMTVPEAHRGSVAASIASALASAEVTALPPRRISPGSMKVLMVWIIKAPLTYLEEEGRDLTLLLEGLRFPFKIEQNPERL